MAFANGGVAGQVQRELDVVRGDRDAVLPPDVSPQVVRPLGVVGRMFPSFREPAFEVPARIGRHQGEEYQRVAVSLVRVEHTDIADCDGHRGRARRCIIPAGTASRGTEGQHLQQPLAPRNRGKDSPSMIYYGVSSSHSSSICQKASAR